ncbi:MAG TPA: hypothetical protein VMW24_28675, partial [Sedimentisphaerales bacterium]|nr:hypothetical protein [Sedimentisphaerales bacterium]
GFEHVGSVKYKDNDSKAGYGQTPGQLGSMKSGSINEVLQCDNVLTAEPQSKATTRMLSDAELASSKVTKQKNSPSDEARRKKGLSVSETMENIITDGKAETQIGEGLVGGDKDWPQKSVTATDVSIAETISHTCESIIKKQKKKQAENGTIPSKTSKPSAILATQKYTDSEHTKELNLKLGDIACVLSSPPFESSDNRGAANMPVDYFVRSNGTPFGEGKSTRGTLETPGNIGNDKGPTFWESAKIIVSECHKILRPGGHAIWVVKDFVRKGQRVDFCGDWQRLCESVGFKTVCKHRAMLVKETSHDGLFGTIKQKKERKSFFRRLAEKKGSPRIDWEMVICMERQS